MDDSGTKIQLHDDEFIASKIQPSYAPVIVSCILTMLVFYIIYTNGFSLYFSVEKLEVDGVEETFYSGGWSIFWFIVLIFMIYQVIKNIMYLYSFDVLITNRRLVGYAGTLFVTSLDVPIEKVDQISVKYPIIGGMFNYASLLAYDEGKIVKINHIKNPLSVKKRLNEARTKTILNRW